VPFPLHALYTCCIFSVAIHQPAIWPQGLTLRQQASLWSRVSVAAYVHGAALSNWVFMPQNSVVVQIVPRPRPDHVHDVMFTEHMVRSTYMEARFGLDTGRWAAAELQDSSLRCLCWQEWEGFYMTWALALAPQFDVLLLHTVYPLYHCGQFVGKQQQVFWLCIVALSCTDVLGRMLLLWE
jgi:hypothetical protein